MTQITFRSQKRVALLGLVCFCITTVIFLLIYTDVFSKTSAPNQNAQIGPRDKFLHSGENGEIYGYNREMPMIFIGGMPRSGTTLMRVMLDSHPDIRCGGETRIIPRILNLRNTWLRSPVEYHRLKEAGISEDVLDSAIGEFMLEIIVRHGKPARRLCNKDPFTLKSAAYIRKLFPRAQFIFMVRDARAVVHSIVTRKVTISGFNLTDHRQCLEKWNSAVSTMYDQCIALGPKVCHIVNYEQLVLHPEQILKGALSFLNVSWNEAVLHHEKFIDEGGIEMSKLERSTDQVVKPINTEQLSAWVGFFADDVIKDMATLAPMLEVLGYDSAANPPNYGNPDPLVVAKMRHIQEHKDIWKAKERKMIKLREDMRGELAHQLYISSTDTYSKV